MHIHPPPERISPASGACVTNRTYIRIFSGLFRGTFRAFPGLSLVIPVAFSWRFSAPDLPQFCHYVATMFPHHGQTSRFLFCLSAAAGCIGHRLRPVRGGTGYAGRDGSCVTPSYALFCFTAVAETVEVSRGGFLLLHWLKTGDLQGKIRR